MKPESFTSANRSLARNLGPVNSPFHRGSILHSKRIIRVLSHTGSPECSPFGRTVAHHRYERLSPPDSHQLPSTHDSLTVRTPSSPEDLSISAHSVSFRERPF